MDAAFAALEGQLDRYRTGPGFILYTALTTSQIKALSVAVDAVSEPISKVAAVVAA
jgi:iron uptake system component EfeO